MKILIACEESQTVCKAFRDIGLDAFSCDIQDCSGGHPEWHIRGFLEDIIGNGNEWGAIIAFPPCTHLSASGARHFKEKVLDGRQQYAINFFMMIANRKCDYIAIENPVGIMSTKWRKPDQIIQPWQFGHPESKSTCLWLKGFPKLQPTKIAEFKKYRCKCGNTFDSNAGKYGCCPDYAAKPLWDNQTKSGQNKIPPSADRSKMRSKTYTGIAEAMADQWGSILKNV